MVVGRIKWTVKWKVKWTVLEGKVLENTVKKDENEQIWLEMKETMVSREREVCGCAKEEGKNLNSKSWNVEMMKLRKKSVWKYVRNTKERLKVALVLEAER